MDQVFQKMTNEEGWLAPYYSGDGALMITGEDGKPARLTSGNFSVFRESSDRRVREEAFEGMFGTYKKYINTFASLYSGSVKKDNMYADIRGYASACEASLNGSNVPLAVYDSLPFPP